MTSVRRHLEQAAGRPAGPASSGRLLTALLVGLLSLRGTTAKADDPPPAVDAGVEAPDEIPFGSRLGPDKELVMVVVRTVDATTSAPIAGATVDAHLELQHPMAGLVSPVATAKSGTDGWTRIPFEGRGNGTSPWIYASAEGYAPATLYLSDPTKTEIRLRRGIDVTVEVRDLLERPVASARVGYHLGCGHTPDVRDVRTGADGRAVLSGIDPDEGHVWVVADGLASAYFELHGYRAGDPPRVLRHAFAAVIEGRILSHEGNPVVGAAVGARAFHRGPWTRTDADGRFRLVGYAATPGEGEFQVETTDPPVTQKPVVPSVTVVVPLPGHPRIVRLPAPDAEDPSTEIPEGAEFGNTRVHVVVRVKGTKKPAVEAQVALVRAKDGWTRVGASDEHGEATFETLTGLYRVIVGAIPGSEGPVWAVATTELNVVSEGPQLVVVEVETPPTIEIDVLDLPEDVELRLVTATSTRTVLWESDHPLVRIPHPPGDPAAVVLSKEGFTRTIALPLAAPAPDAKPVKIAWPGPATVAATYVDPTGTPVAVRAAIAKDPPEFDSLDALDPAETQVLEVERTTEGLALWIEPSDPHFRRMVVRLPDPLPDKALDLGSIALVPTVPSPLVLFPDGSPAAGLEIAVSRGALRFAATLGAGGRIENPDEDVFGALAPDATILVLAPDATAKGGTARYPLRAVLSGPPPWTIRWPRGAIDVRALDDEARPLPEFQVVVDGDVYSGRGGAWSMDGVPAGVHDVVVASPGRRSRTFKIETVEGPSKVVEARLDRVPSAK